MRILIGAPVRQDHTTFYKYLKAIDKLDIDGLEVDCFFIFHNSPRLVRFMKQGTTKTLCTFTTFTTKNDYLRDEKTHHWTNENLSDVILMKNHLLNYAKKLEYDYFFLVDSDIILQPQTLKQLISRKKDIIAEVFWTRWSPNEPEMPNAWQADFYSFAKNEEWEDWKQEGLFQVGMTGACILISKNVIQAGVNYTPIYNVSHSIWEDRAFCIRAACAGFDIWLDTNCPPLHLYRQTKPVKPSKDKRKQPHKTK